MAARLSRFVPLQLPFLIAIVLLAALPLRAHAQIWTEQIDAPPLPMGQLTLGSGSLTEIDGNLSTSQDADMYMVRAQGRNALSLLLCQPNSVNVYVFDQNGYGVTAASSCHDINIDLPAGTYFIALAWNNVQPIAQAGANLVPMWGGLGLGSDSPQTPANPGLTPIILWQGGTSSTLDDSYYLTLQGFTYVSPAPVPVNATTWGHVKATYR